MIELNAKSIVSANVLNLETVFLIISFICDQEFSIGLRSGEYGGRNNKSHLCLLTNFSVGTDLWNLALSKTNV